MKRRLLAFLAVLVGVDSARLEAQTSTLYAVEQNGSRSQRLNIVFLSEGYTTADLPNFATHVNNAVNVLFTKQPWQQYRSYCNVYRIEIASNESGCDNGNTSGPNGVRDTYFNTGFFSPTIGQLLSVSGSGSANGGTRALALLNTHVPEYDVSIILVNDTKYGGAGGNPAVASIVGASALIVEHELGHSFANLTDEYDSDYFTTPPPEKANSTQQTVRELIKWNHWIDPSTALPTTEHPTFDNIPGLFEGCNYRAVGWYRPHNNSVMRNIGRACGEVNREQFVLKYYAQVSPIDASSPSTASRNVTAFENLSFSVTPKVPSSGVVLLVQWKIDNTVQAATSSTFTTSSEFLGNGSHTVTATVRDPTPFVRLDPTGLLDDSVTWPFSLSNQLPAELTTWRTTYGTDTANPAKDGLVNLVKYALGLNPSQRATTAQFPAPSTTGNYLTLTVPRRNKRADVDYIVEVSSDLVTWHSGPGYTVTLQDDETALIARDAQPQSGATERFIRLRVQER